ncbi:MAG: extracellular solute-binding protein [Oscillospiraceae bacterium]
MKIKKIAALALSILLCASLAACTPSSSSSSTPASQSSASTGEDSSQAEGGDSSESEAPAPSGDAQSGDYGGLAALPDAGDPITYNVFVRDPGMAPAADNPAIQKVTELTGVSIKYEFLVGDLAQKLGVMIAGGDYPDAIFAGDSASKLIEAGAFIPLEDKYTQYGNLNALYSDAAKYLTEEDGHIYNLEIYGYIDNSGRLTEPAPIFECGIGFYIQKAVLEEFDYPVPRTVDEYFKLIEDYKAKYPEIDGVKTVGFEILSDGWRNWALVNPTQNLLGASNDGALFVEPDTLATSFFQVSDTAKEYYKKLNEAYHKGLIEPETFTQSYDQYISRISTGAVLGFYDQNWNFGSGRDVLKADGKFERTYVAVPLTNPGVTDGYIDAPSGIPTGTNGIGITVNCENPDRLLQFYDWMLQREVQDYLQWGEEGTDWMLTEDGGKALTAERRAIMYDVAQKRDLTGFTLWNYAPKLQGIYTADGMPTGTEESPDEYLASQSDYDKAFLESYGYKYPAEMHSDPVLRPAYYPIWAMTLEDGSAAAVSNTKITDVTTKYYPRLILAADDAEYDSIWDSFIAEFEAIDLDAYQTEIDRQIQVKMSK